MKTRILFVAAAILALAGCDRGLTAGDALLQGAWRADLHFSDPTGQGPSDMYDQLTFGPGNRFTSEVFYYGSSGHPASELTYYYRVEGEYRLDGDSLEIRTFREMSSAPGFPGNNYVHILHDGWASMGTVEIQGSHLTRRYVSAGLDVPVPTVVTYTRIDE